ncbi:MAG: helix-turn-helix transcriptional regulator [Flavisolibacter sp.]|nr:helix-turn-helix transcriptional regulator [Flavisolibacter sp.]
MKTSTVVYYEQKVREIIDFIQNHYDQSLTLAILDQKFALSPFHLSRIFKKIAKQKLSTYLNQIRVEKAFSLMITTNKRINDIAFETGFNDYETLSRSFKKHYKVAPEDLRTIVSIIKMQANLPTGCIVQYRYAVQGNKETIEKYLIPGAHYVYKAERNKGTSSKREKFTITPFNYLLCKTICNSGVTRLFLCSKTK